MTTRFLVVLWLLLFAGTFATGDDVAVIATNNNKIAAGKHSGDSVRGIRSSIRADMDDVNLDSFDFSGTRRHQPLISLVGEGANWGWPRSFGQN
jgi:hypothetical protein